MKANSTSRLRDNLLKALAVTAVAAVPGAAFAPAALAAPSTDTPSLPSGCDLDLSGGVGTYTDPFQIRNERQLAELHDCGTDESYYYYELENDIVLTTDDSKWWDDNEYGWDPIGGSGSGDYFTGYVNGNGHTISGLWQNQYDWGDNQGLFGYTDNATIKNLTVEGTIDANGYDNIGGLIGYGEYTTVSNVHTNVAIENSGSDSDDVGGIIGNAYYASVSKSSSEGDITNDINGNDIGGLVGYGEYFSVYKSSSSSQVNSVDNAYNDNEYVGGLVGYGDYGTITDSTFSGSATGYYYVGGAIGYADYVNVDGVDITSDALVQAESGYNAWYIGGVSGYQLYSGVSNSTFSGELDGHQQYNEEIGYAGGIVGEAYDANVSNVHVTSDAVLDFAGDGSDSYYVGGVVGYLDYANVADATNKAAVNAADIEYVGGIIGYGTEGSSVTEAINTGDVTIQDDNGANNYYGGIAGYLEDGGTIANSANKGDVWAGGDDDTYYLGGVVGYLDNGSQVVDSYNLGSVEGNGDVAGIAGWMDDDSDISFSYNAGEVNGLDSDAEEDGIANGNWADTANSNVVLDTETSIATNTNSQQLVTSEVKDASVLAGLGWSINEANATWSVDADFNDGYPYLSYEYTAASAGVQDVVFAPVSFVNRSRTTLPVNAAAYLSMVAAQINAGNYAKVEIDGYSNRKVKAKVARARTAAVKQFLRDAGVEAAIVVHNNIADSAHRTNTVVVTAIG